MWTFGIEIPIIPSTKGNCVLSLKMAKLWPEGRPLTPSFHKPLSFVGVRQLVSDSSRLKAKPRRSYGQSVYLLLGSSIGVAARHGLAKRGLILPAQVTDQ